MMHMFCSLFPWIALGTFWSPLHQLLEFLFYTALINRKSLLLVTSFFLLLIPAKMVHFVHIPIRHITLPKTVYPHYPLSNSGLHHHIQMFVLLNHLLRVPSSSKLGPCVGPTFPRFFSFTHMPLHLVWQKV